MIKEGRERMSLKGNAPHWLKLMVEYIIFSSFSERLNSRTEISAHLNFFIWIDRPSCFKRMSVYPYLFEECLQYFV